MSILITSDIQAEFNNLELCNQAWEECLSICKERKIKTIAYLGDGKQAYNPVDIRVIKWWQYAIRKAVKLGIEILYDLGNHDRVGQYTDADNWLPILRRAGATVYDVPAVKELGWTRLFILPFSGISQTKRNITELLKRKPNKDEDVLLFHQDIKGCEYNKLGGKSDASLSPSDIKCNSFKYCVSGHIHHPQCIQENIYYVGSPFCHDWGEVNQVKRYLIVGKDRIESINSNIPRWFDPGVDGFYRSRPNSWKNARVRLQVICDASKDYGRTIERARKDAGRKYKGADIFIVTKFKDKSELDIKGIRTTDSDERKLNEYIKQAGSLPKSHSRRRLVEYMLEKLSHFSGGLRTGSKVKFIYSKGINFLPFEKLKTDFTNKGITVIQGINEDRNKKSNGAAKTSLVQIIPVSMFGRTFKDQKADRWANRWRPKEQAIAETVLRDYKHRKIKIIRGRNPPMLRMLVDGNDVSSGMKSNDKDGTQAQIEQITGFTWQTLANAVYIDRAVADSFLSGTRKQRTDVLSRFQNLERFEKSLELVKKDERKNREALLDSGEKLSAIRSSIFECKESVDNLYALSKTQLDSAYAEFLKHKRALKLWHANTKLFKQLEYKATKIKHKYDKLVSILRNKELIVSNIRHDLEKLEHEGIKWYRLKKKQLCPTCLQPVKADWVKIKDSRLHSKNVKLINQKANQDKIITRLRQKVQLLDGRHTELQMKIGRMETARLTLEGFKKTAQRQWMELASDKHASQHIINKTKNKLKELIASKVKLKHKIKKYRKLNSMYEYSMEAFSRDGIPAFLNASLCPILNKSALYYSELFSNSEIQVRFKVEGGDFVPEIINTKGGMDIEDQSTGERALAGLIASFALREVAPRCNVLILDEPGDGLDEQTAKQFARSLQKLTKRFGSIWVASHNVHILSELSSERVITVVKKNGISKVNGI